jgi:phage baseplate assembly protein W|tara:strand:- start:692 stop:1072 length:381 start_codon:yes stop_codon:yes gene_type:complete
MAFGFSPIIPLQKDDEDGFYALTKTLADNVKQNFKNLLLTAPGERVMIPEFGVGLRNFLFDNSVAEMENDIIRAVDEQTKLYMPFVEINDLEVIDTELDTVALNIFYSVPSVGISDLITISKNNIV